MDEHNLRRGAALIIDFFLISTAYMVLANMVPDPMLRTGTAVHPWSLSVAPDWYFLVCAAYFLGCDLFNKGESLGKDILGLRTRTAEGGTPGLPQRVLRTLLKLVSLSLLPFALLLFFWKGRGLTLQDYVTGTTVLSSRGVNPQP
jgi:uncharacterized RDD family membrane protein YckC